MRTNHFLFKNRYGMAYRFILRLPSILLFLLVVSDARVGGRQGVIQTKITVEDPRPVAKAIIRLEEKHKWIITYEDPRYVHESEITDVTLIVRRDLDKYKPGKAPKVLIPKKRELTFAYADLPNMKFPADAAMVVQKLLDAQSSQEIGGRFRLESDGKIMHVIPTAIRNNQGLLVAQNSILDTIVTLPEKDAPVFDKINSVLLALSHLIGTPVELGAYPTMFHTFRHQKGAIKRKARDILVEIFSAKEHGGDLSWQLNYNPGLKVYIFNIYHVTLLDGKT